VILPLNPYVAGNPVGDSPAFVGRADVLREVARVLRRPQDNAVVLYGQRRIGKTSILQHLEARLPGEGPYCPVYFDLQDKAAWPLGRVLQDLARTVAHALDRPDPDLGHDPETAFREEWLPVALDALPAGGGDEGGAASLVLLFDEFDVLTDPGAEQAAATFFPYLRGLLASDPGRLQFVFVIGRNVDDLDHIALSLFKGTPAMRVSLLSREDTAELVRLSQGNDTLQWPDEAVERVWELTNGHPFLTQQLCSHAWERAYDDEKVRRTSEVRRTSPADVDAAVPGALEASRNTLEWLWDGLPPAERVVASALAAAGPGPITQDDLERLLHESGVRVVIRELQNAPELLQEWDLIEPADGDEGYRFRVELLRRWLAEHKPLKRVQEELDRIEPVAESLYRGGRLDQAVGTLRQAVAINPNHVGANQLLADILLAQGQPGRARELLERLHEYQPAAARSRLIQALLAAAQSAEEHGEQLALYERVLELNPRQPEASAGIRRIWRRRGDAAVEDDDLEAALEAYGEAGLADQVAEIERAIRRRTLTARLRELGTLQQAADYQAALELARELADEYPEARERLPDLEQLEHKTHLAELYRRGLGALQSDDRETARALLAQVVALEPGYEEATRYLHQAVEGVDVVEVQRQLEGERAARREAEAAAELGDGGGPAWLSRAPMLILVAFLAGGLSGFLGSGWVMPFLRPTPTVTVASTSTSTPTATSSPESVPGLPPANASLGDTWTRPRPADGVVMVHVPGGTFPMGSDEDDVDDALQLCNEYYDDCERSWFEEELSVHDVALDAFWIDRTEVTNAQYAAFLNKRGNQEEGGVAWLDLEDEDCLIEQRGGEFEPKSGYADHPVIDVSWYGAAAYCEWAGARLPTEAEWEYAARGEQGNQYPWGSADSTCDLAQYSGCSGSTVPVGSLPDGASWCGALDMAGNVWEWVAGWYGDYPSGSQTNPTGPEMGEYRVLRGGSWYISPSALRCATRGRYRPGSVRDNVGFRCARGSR
jgi:formylglycine-generating enzyme required for sulfatase activity/tetratricopeptide (TPR) repeat protein